MEIPAIQIRGLTARFGGVTAIGALDLAVERGKITAIIGPNGAGKTTLFNCISGVLRPTAGTILVAGRDVRRPWRMKTTWACLGIGLLTAALSGCLALNVNGLWRAAIRRPNNFSAAPFSQRAMLEGLTSYWHGELAVERGSLGRWNIVTADGGILLVTVEEHAHAQQLRDRYERLRLSPPSALRLVSSGKQWLLVPGDNDIELTADDKGPLFASRQAAIDRRDLLISIASESKARRSWTCAATFAGLLLGLFGMASVWKRTRWTPELIAAAGVARTFQNLRLFAHLSVLENVLVACEASRGLRGPGGYPGTGFKKEQRHRPGGLSSVTCARELLDFVGLAAVTEYPAGQLAYGDRRRLEIARALGQRPWLLLLDEPAAGMNPTEKTQLKDILRRLCDSGITVVLIEHEMSLVMGISDHVIVLANGRKIAEGTPDVIRRHPEVIEAYLGTDCSDV